MTKILRLSCLFISVISLCNFASAEKLNKIVIKGNQRIETSTIREYIGVEEGSDFTSDKQSDVIKSLYGTSLFENITTDFTNNVLTVTVQETPFVSKVVFVGNSKVKTNIIMNEIQTAAGESLKKGRLQQDVEKIKEIYKRSGRFSIDVKAKVEQQGNNAVKVVFEVMEGPKTGIKTIKFIGNSNYSDSELRSIILTKESKWFRFLESNDAYDPERIEYDKYLLTKFYNSVGFADFRVISVTADLLPTKEGFILTYSIEEGDKYKFGNIVLHNKIKHIKDSEVAKFIPKKTGDTFNLAAMESASEKISDYLGSRGYPQVDVYPEVKADKSTRIADIELVIDNADKIFINNINIEGNLKTEDRVIRRQLKIAEGDVYNRSKIEKGEQNIRNLDYFDKFTLKLNPTPKRDRYDININVEEKSTASLGFDLGYNTSGGPFGRISFTERNLLGTGKYFNMGVQAGKKSTNYYLGVTEPAFLDRDLSLGVNFFNNYNGRGSGFTSGEQNYTMNSVGGKLSLGYDLMEDLSHEIDYSLKRDKLTGSSSSASRFIVEQMGTYVTSAIGHSLTFDQTDSRVLPKNGYILVGSQEYAGLGGDTKYLKHEAEAKWFKSFVENKYTLKLATSAGHIKGTGGKKVRISDRFNLGEYSLRGFESGGVGPRDKLTKEGFGGQKFYTVSTELSFPSGLPEEFNVICSIFADAGALWDADSTALSEDGFYNDKSIRASVGFGVLWVTKIAPIKIDWAFPVKKKKYDETRNFHIKFSTHF